MPAESVARTSSSASISAVGLSAALAVRKPEARQAALEGNMPGTMRAREEAPPALSCNIDAHAKQLIVETLILHRIGRRSSRDKTDDERAGHDKPRLAHPMNHGFPRGDLTYFVAALPLSQHRAALTSNLAVIVSHWSSLMRSTIGKRVRLRHLGAGARATAPALCLDGAGPGPYPFAPR